jgi:genome maintenance exonuclease 1
MEHKIEYHDGGVVLLNFDPKKHYYNVEGKYAPSVTTILDSIAKPALIPWAANEGAKWFMENCDAFSQAEVSPEDMVKGIRGAYRKRSKAAMNIGMAVHKWCEEAILFKLGKGLRPLDVVGEEATNAVDACKKWVKENNVEWHTAEEKVYHRGHKYAGTVDATATVNDEYCVIDFKTSKAIYAPYHLQCAAYARAIEDMTGKEIDKAYVLRFDKESGDFEAASSTELQENFIAFLGVMEGYSRIKELENRSGK